MSKWDDLEVECDFVYFIMSKSAPDHYLSEATEERRRWTRDAELAMVFPSERTTSRFLKKYFKDNKDYRICGSSPDNM